MSEQPPKCEPCPEGRVRDDSGKCVMPDVTFTHRTHAEAYLNNDCMVCHAHTNIRDNTIWDCAQCHSSEDDEGWCPDDADGHDCWMVQCQQCHQQYDPAPTPNCVDCH